MKKQPTPLQYTATDQIEGTAISEPPSLPDRGKGLVRFPRRQAGSTFKKKKKAKGSAKSVGNNSPGPDPLSFKAHASSASLYPSKPALHKPPA
ncbi:unnamed protein product [Linum trigynum]|uniref:Uncharacterized protein n=1 Tax=Linum trigynum TaxID=586398 RepID=A0AAV2FUK2_9ROSI